MSNPEELRVLLGEIRRELEVLARVESFLSDYIDKRIHSPGRQTEQAMTLCQGLTNYYTCIETLFLRVARTFENSIAEERWHQSLLDRMVIDVPDVRPRVLSDDTHRDLLELLKFRHFARYYFQLDYDWEKLEFVAGKFLAVRGRVRSEFEAFIAYVGQLIAASDQA